MNKKAIFFIVIVIALSLLSFVLIQKDRNLAGDIEKCNSEPQEMRFSCYRNALEKNYTKNLQSYIGEIENNENISFGSKDKSYAIFGTNCHTFYHAVGDFIATKDSSSPLYSLVEHCPSQCTGGCIMGLYKRKALEKGYPSTLLKDFYNNCRGAELHQCAHEVGHLIHDKYTTSILSRIDAISEKEYGLKYKDKYKYTTFTEPNLNIQFEECRKLLPEEEWNYCFTGIGHNQFLFSEFSPEGFSSQFAQCDTVNSQDKELCFGFLLFRIGINDAATRMLGGDVFGGFDICEKTVNEIGRPNFLHHCYRGIGGGIGLFIESEHMDFLKDPEQVLSERQYGLLEKTVLNSIDLCSESKNESLEKECINGLLGTKFKTIYQILDLKNDKVEKIILESLDYEVVG